jgi:hypothetical protein
LLLEFLVNEYFTCPAQGIISDPDDIIPGIAVYRNFIQRPAIGWHFSDNGTQYVINQNFTGEIKRNVNKCFFLP